MNTYINDSLSVECSCEVSKTLRIDVQDSSSEEGTCEIGKQSCIRLNEEVPQNYTLNILKHFINRVSKFFNILYIKARRIPVYKITLKRRRY